MDAPSIEQVAERYIEIAFPDERCPVEQEVIDEAKKAFIAGAFMTFHLWGELTGLDDKIKAAMLLNKMMKEAESACDETVKQAFLKNR